MFLNNFFGCFYHWLVGGKKPPIDCSSWIETLFLGSFFSFLFISYVGCKLPSSGTMYGLLKE